MSYKIRLLDWKGFESVVREVLEAHDFEVKSNIRIGSRKKYEVDILAKRLDTFLCVECKRWSRGRYKKSSLRKEAEKHEERCKAVEKIIGRKVIPLIVTLEQEELLKEGNVLFVPFSKLNSFLCNLEMYVRY